MIWSDSGETSDNIQGADYDSIDNGGKGDAYDTLPGFLAPTAHNVSDRVPNWFWHPNNTVMPLSQFQSIYYHSVGMNTTLILNVPPATGGKFDTADVNLLQQLGTWYSSLYKTNLLASPGNYEPGWVASDDSNIDLSNDSLICSLPYATWTTTAGTQEDLPMNCLTWWEAYAFCIWDGGFLPSDGEYEYAAAGGSQQRAYPWGTAAPGTANQYAICGCNYPHPGTCSGVANVAPVGTASAGAGRWGQLDLVGDLSEWTLDWYQATYDSPCTDCADLTEASGRVTRGAYFSSDATLLAPTYRTGLYGTSRGQNLGFRCARIP